MPVIIKHSSPLIKAVEDRFEGDTGPLRASFRRTLKKIPLLALVTLGVVALINLVFKTKIHYYDTLVDWIIYIPFSMLVYFVFDVLKND